MEGEKTIVCRPFRASLNKALNGEQLAKEDVITLLEAREGEEVDQLFAAADRVRRLWVGDEVHFRGIVEFSNYCRNNCLYCGLRRGNGNLQRYRMEPGEIYEACARAAERGFKTIVLQSGEDIHYTQHTLAGLVKSLKKEYDIAVTLSLGERNGNFYTTLRQAGADRYLLKHETADESLFARLRPGTTLKRRLENIKYLQSLGYKTGSGNMVGLPGQTLESIAGDILLMRELDVDMAGIGPFIPGEYTPLAGSCRGELLLTLKTLAVTRLAVPRAHLPATTALAKIHPVGREMGLKCGANVIMPNVTPAVFQKHYKIYPGKEESKSLEEQVKTLHALVDSLGRKVAAGRGDPV